MVCPVCIATAVAANAPALAAAIGSVAALKIALKPNPACKETYRTMNTTAPLRNAKHTVQAVRTIPQRTIEDDCKLRTEKVG
jgi:hypothetical protein